jgi:hypothetical protein
MALIVYFVKRAEEKEYAGSSYFFNGLSVQNGGGKTFGGIIKG